MGVLAGNSVHVDKQFLAAYMPELVEHLHYRFVEEKVASERFTADRVILRIVGEFAASQKYWT